MAFQKGRRKKSIQCNMKCRRLKMIFVFDLVYDKYQSQGDEDQVPSGTVLQVRLKPHYHSHRK